MHLRPLLTDFPCFLTSNRGYKLYTLGPFPSFPIWFRMEPTVSDDGVTQHTYRVGASQHANYRPYHLRYGVDLAGGSQSTDNLPYQTLHATAS